MNFRLERPDWADDSEDSKLVKLFESYANKSMGVLDFDKIENKLSKRPDLHVFLLLDKLCPSEKDIISSAEHDEFWLDIKPDELVKAMGDRASEIVLELVRCGVMFDGESFSMFT